MLHLCPRNGIQSEPYAAKVRRSFALYRKDAEGCVSQNNIPLFHHERHRIVCAHGFAAIFEGAERRWLTVRGRGVQDESIRLNQGRLNDALMLHEVHKEALEHASTLVAG